MSAFLQDLRYGVRLLAKQPSLAVISIFALALGIGLTTTMWSIVYGGILRGLPFEEADRIVHLERARPSRGIESYGVPIHDFTAWREAQQSFEDLAAFYEGTVNVSGVAARPERFEGAFVTPSTFPLLRVRPALGRLFLEEEGRTDAPPVVLIGWDLWQQRFGGDSAVIGRTLRANGVLSEIVGVLPRGFLFPTNARIWLPLRVSAASVQPWGSGQFYEVMGRLKSGVTMAQARAEFENVTARLAQEHPEQNEGVGPVLKPFTEEYIDEEPIRMLWTMMAAVFGVLLIACSNVANLLLARAAVRTKEVAIRTALGASRRRVIAQLLTEALLLAGAGAILGSAIAWVGVRLFNNAIADTEPPFWIDIRLDGPVLLFAGAVTVLAALVSGVVPALQATRPNVHDVLKDESRGASSLRLGRFSKGLVVAELALSCGLLVAAGFMIQSVVRRTRFDYGVRTEDVFTTRLGLFETAYPDSASRARFWRDLEQQLATLPGQQGVALTTVLPGLGAWVQPFALDGHSYAEDRDYPRTRRVAVTPSFFPTFRLAPLEGRVLAEGDVGDALPVAVVSRGFAARHFPDGSPVGRRIRIGTGDSREPWLTIAGVVPDVWFQGTGDEINETIYTAIAQGDFRFLSVAMPAAGNPMALAEPVRAAVMALDADQPIYFTRTLEEAIWQSGWFYAVFGTLFMVFGAAAFVLAAIGVYGIMSFAVSRRTQEVGVRMALGARARDVVAMFLRQGALEVGAGVVLGLGLATLLSRGLRLVLFQVDTGNPLMFAAVSLALAATGMIASFVPARRAARVDPMEALRYE